MTMTHPPKGTITEDDKNIGDSLKMTTKCGETCQVDQNQSLLITRFAEFKQIPTNSKKSSALALFYLRTI